MEMACLWSGSRALPNYYSPFIIELYKTAMETLNHTSTRAVWSKHWPHLASSLLQYVLHRTCVLPHCVQLYCNFSYLSQSWLLSIYMSEHACGHGHTCLASLRWEPGVGTRRLMETGYTHPEYWWDVVQTPQMFTSETHAQSHLNAQPSPLSTCHNLHSLVFIANIL